MMAATHRPGQKLLQSEFFYRLPEAAASSLRRRSRARPAACGAAVWHTGRDSLPSSGSRENVITAGEESSPAMHCGTAPGFPPASCPTAW
jgi:hypothetical protein